MPRRGYMPALESLTSDVPVENFFALYPDRREFGTILAQRARARKRIEHELTARLAGLHSWPAI